MMETTDTRPLLAELEQLRDKLSVAMPLIKAQGAEIADLRQRLGQAEQRAAAAEARWEWWFGPTSKDINDYLRGVREGWTVDQWTSWADAARGAKGGRDE